MFKKLLIFGAGTLFGAYVMRNCLYKTVTDCLIESQEEELELYRKNETSKTEKES
jgi:hypothetical protein